ncbi:MAG: efflux RND transporter periplasmic adaptor subunit [Acidobacteriaceae bacterium]
MASNESGASPPAGAPATIHTKRPAALIIAAVCVLLVAAIAVYFYLHSRPTALVYSGTVETREIQAGSKVGGRVTAVFVEEGQHVAVDAPLVSFECDALKAQLAEAKATVEQAGADFNRLQTGNRPEEIVQADAQLRQQADALQESKNGPRPQEILAAGADFAAAQATAADAAANYSRMEPLVEHDVISRQQFDQVTAHKNATAQQAESLRQKVAILQAGTRPEYLRQADQRYQQALASDTLMHRGFRRQDIQAGHGRLAEAQAHVQEIEASLREANLAAPAAGVIEVVSVRPGDLVPPGQIVVSMLESSQLWVKVYIPETDLSRLRIGQVADVSIDAYPGRPFAGHIQEIASQAEFLPRNVQTRDDRQHLLFAVKVAVENANDVLKSGMSATVHLP